MESYLYVYAFLIIMIAYAIVYFSFNPSYYIIIPIMMMMIILQQDAVYHGMFPIHFYNVSYYLFMLCMYLFTCKYIHTNLYL